MEFFRHQIATIAVIMDATMTVTVIVTTAATITAMITAIEDAIEDAIENVTVTVDGAMVGTGTVAMVDLTTAVEA